MDEGEDEGDIPPLSAACSWMRARSRLNSLSSAPANCLGDSLLYMRRRRGARTGARRWPARRRVRWAYMAAGEGGWGVGGAQLVCGSEGEV